MLKISNSNKTKWISNIILASFLFFVAGTMFLSNIFKTPIKGQLEFIEQSMAFSSNELENILGLTLKNKSGEFVFEHLDIQTGSVWHMTSPRKISVNSIFIEKLFSSLKIIKTKKILDDNKINNSNFSLEKPMAMLILKNSNGENITISLGIMNAIDNSTYMKISGKKGIYHVESPSLSLENIALPDLIESTVFDVNFNTILGFKISKKNSKKPIFEIIKKDNTWVNSENQILDTKNLEYIIDDFIALKSSFTLESPSDAQKKQTQSLLLSPEFIIEIKKEDKEILFYKISTLTRNLIEVPLNDEDHFIIKGDHSAVTYVIKKDFINIFNLTNANLKTLAIPNN